MLKAAAIFKNNMILQRNATVAIFGQTDCTSVIVNFCDKEYEADINNNSFIAYINTDDRSEALSLEIVGNAAGGTSERITISNILLGEVWLAGGQSNMELELQNSENATSVMSKANYENIRFYNVPKCELVDEHLYECEENTSWRSVTSDKCQDMSAVGFYFAKKLYEKLQVPIGIIDCYWGGTSATCWCAPDKLEGVNEVRGYLNEWKQVCEAKSDETYDEELKAYYESVNTWQEKVDKLREENPDIEWVDINEIAGPYPWPMPRGRKSPYRPFGLHESMVSRIAPYKIKGAIYYQGEEDAERASYYDKLNMAVIKQWREDFANPDLPFFITQLPMFISSGEEDNRVWGQMRLQQEKCSLMDENVGMAVICDCGEFDNIHPVDKLTPGNRLAGQVLDKVYGILDGMQNMQAKDFVFDNNKCTICFNNVGESICYRHSDGKNLTAKGSDIAIADGAVEEGVIYGFEVVNSEGDRYKPSLEINGNVIGLIGNDGEEIVAVSYAMFNYGVANVYNAAGLPLMPFEANK